VIGRNILLLERRVAWWQEGGGLVEKDHLLVKSEISRKNLRKSGALAPGS